MGNVDTRFLNGIRIILALWVAVGHFYKYNGGENLLYIPIISELVLANGAAVDGFMIITGFLMMYHYILKEQTELPSAKSTIQKFWIRRIFRLYPLYCLAIFVAYFLYDSIYNLVYENLEYFASDVQSVGYTYIPEAIPNLFDLFAHLTFLHGFIPGVNDSILGPAWSLSLEMQFYFVFPFLFLAFFRKINKYMVFVSVAAIVIGFLTPKLLGEWENQGMLTSFIAPSLLIYKIQFFHLGMLMGAVVLKRAKITHLVIFLILFLPFQNIVSSTVSIGIVFFMFTDVYKSKLNKYVFKLIISVKDMLSNKVLAYFGDLSYSIYLIHMIIMPYVVKLTIYASPFNPIVTFAFALVAFLIVNIVISHFLFKYLEKPFTKFGKNYVKNQFNSGLNGKLSA